MSRPPAVDLTEQSPTGNEPGGGIHLLEYWRVLQQRRWTALGALVTVVGVTMLFTFFATPQYRATTTIQIERQGPEILTFKDVLGVDQAAYQDFYQTQYKILQSRSIVLRAAEKLDLVNRPEYAKRNGSPIQRIARWARGVVSGGAGEEDPVERARRFIEEGLSVEPVRKSHLVKISFVDRNGELARDVANAVADSYVQFHFDARYDTTAQAKQFLTKQVARLQSEIVELQKRAQEYGARNEILALGDGAADISEQGLADLNKRLTEAKGRLAIAQARRESVEQSEPSELPEALESNLIATLKGDYAEIERRHGQMAKRFKPDWPELVEVRQELEQTRQRLELELAAIARHVRGAAGADYREARAEVENLERLLEAQKAEVQRVNLQTIDFAGLEAEIDTKREILRDLSSRQSETETSDHLKDTRASNIRVIDPAIVPRRAVSPRKTLNLMLSLFLGASLGIGLAFVLDYLDNTVKTEQDIERIGRIPVLGHLPLVPAIRAVTEEDRDGTEMYQVDMASHVQPRSHVAESFRNLRTSLLLATPDHPPETLVVTSCDPGEGKSTVSLNIATVLTQLGRRVVVVDGDLRRPRVHKAIGLPNPVGLSSYLSGNAPIAELLQDTDVPGLQVITSGPIPPNPSELLGSPGLLALVRQLREQHGFEHVIFDSPPVLQVTDAAILATHMDGTILVVRAGRTTREALNQGALRLRQSRANVLGGVLNAVSEATGAYYYYGRYGRYRYYQYYGEDRAKAGAPDEPARRSKRRASQG